MKDAILYRTTLTSVHGLTLHYMFSRVLRRIWESAKVCDLTKVAGSYFCHSAAVVYRISLHLETIIIIKISTKSTSCRLAGLVSNKDPVLT